MADAVSHEQGAFRGCFGCGPDNPSSLGMKFEREEGEVISRLTMTAEYAGYQDFVHGGIIATMLDEAMGWAVFTLADQYAVTRSLQVDYRRPVQVGKALVVKASVIEKDEATIRLEARIENERGRLLATGIGHWVPVRRARAQAR